MDFGAILVRKLVIVREDSICLNKRLLSFKRSLYFTKGIELPKRKSMTLIPEY